MARFELGNGGFGNRVRRQIGVFSIAVVVVLAAKNIANADRKERMRFTVARSFLSMEFKTTSFQHSYTKGSPRNSGSIRDQGHRPDPPRAGAIDLDREAAKVNP